MGIVIVLNFVWKIWISSSGTMIFWIMIFGRVIFEKMIFETATWNDVY